MSHSPLAWIRIALALVALWMLSDGGRVSAADKPADEKRFVPVDLQPKANQKLDADFHGYTGNNLKPLPRGRRNLGDVDFVIGDKFVQLAGKLAPDFPEKIESIPVDRVAASLHFLHATGWGSPGVEQGTRIGEYVVRFDDKTTETIPIEYGSDLRDWWDFDEAAPVTRAVVAWQGVNEASGNFRGMRIGIRLYRLTWKNPQLAKKVVSLDYVSTNKSICAPFLVAVTTEPPRDTAAVIKALQNVGAFLEFDDRGLVTAVSLSGPGPKAGISRGTDAVVEMLADLPTLEAVSMNASGITDDGLRHLSQLPNLRRLSLNYSRVTDAGLVHLQGLKTLERLRLHDTAVTDAGFLALRDLIHLKVLDLSHTALTDEGLTALQSLTSLEELDIRDTPTTVKGRIALRKVLPRVQVSY